MKNYIEAGEIMPYVASGTVASGAFIVSGGLCGVAQIGGASGDTIPCKRRGVFELAKATGETWSQGDKVYWDATNSRFTKTSSGNTDVGGLAWGSQLSADTTGIVILTA